MDQITLEMLEDKIEEAITEVIGPIELKTRPLLPNRQTMHLMAKAVLTVYEAAVENRRSEG